jgi:UDP-N-acetylmuramoylalanine--D-glutamate ligase
LWSSETPARTLTFNQDLDIKSLNKLLRGSHNEDNLRAALSVVKLFNISDKSIKKTIEKFRPLPHRLEDIGKFKNIFFCDDAISTTPESTMMALQTVKNVGTIFLGGEDRGYKFTQLEKELRASGVKNIVLFPDSGLKMLKSKNGFRVLETSSMHEAVKFAYKYTPASMTCLLSTASPSYSLWKNFEEKGDEFKYWVKTLAD